MILTLNVGSSSLKYTLFDGELRAVTEGEVEDVGRKIPTHEEAVDEVLKVVPAPSVIGHRIVHGGSTFTKPTRVCERVLKKLETLIPLSPLHLPAELSVVKRLHAQGATQVLCFDTAFHRAMPKLHQRLPLPSFLWDEGVKRYGFHGLSYEYIVDFLGDSAKERKVIIAHLGNGASLAAISNGHPIDTTMGFTPTGGIMMGTRSGDLDPGILTYLMRGKGYGASQIDALVNHQSGLLGVSERSADVKELLELQKSDPHAEEALALFCHLARKSIGALAATLGGVDLLVFTGGIGERAKWVRDQILEA
jgi:acetate kinase